MNLKKLISFFDNYFTPIFFGFANILIILEYLTYTNFVLETFRIDYVDTFVIATILLGITLIRKPKKFYKKYWRVFIFLLPIFLFNAFAIIFMRRIVFYKFLEMEDSVFEWLQFIIIATSAVISLILSKKWWKKNKILGIIFLIAAVGFLLIAGEEISWGQRIFDIQTPEEYAKLNTQGETTLHNYGPVFGLVYRGYMMMGLIGATAWILKKPLEKMLPKLWSETIKVIIPNWYYFIYFITVFLYNLERVLNGHNRPGDALWEEAMELLLFFAIFVFLIEQMIYISNKLKFKKRKKKR